MFLYNGISNILWYVKYGTIRGFYSINDCRTGDTELKRMIRNINKWNDKAEKKQEMYQARIEEYNKEEAEYTNMVLFQHLNCRENQAINHPLIQQHLKAIDRIRMFRSSVERISTKLDAVLLTLVDAARQQSLGVDMKEASQYLKTINDYVAYENINTIIDNFSLEVTKADETRQSLDVAVSGMQQDENKRGEQTDGTIVNKYRLQSIFNEIIKAKPIDIHQQQQIQNNGGIEIQDEKMNTEIEKGLEARFQLLQKA